MKTQFIVSIKYTVIFVQFLILNNSLGAQICGENMSATEMCRWGLPYPSCSLEGVDEKCIKLKFHFLNNQVWRQIL